MGNISQLPVQEAHAPSGDQTHNPGVCPDWKSVLRPFGVQDRAPISRAPARETPLFLDEDGCALTPFAKTKVSFHNQLSG